MEVKISKNQYGYMWTIIDDMGAVIEKGTENEKDNALKSAEMALSWIQIGGVY